MAQRDASPVYYREIQKNAYLKRMPDEITGSILRPLALKKAPLKPMWTQLCVHNGRTPYLEQYRDRGAARAHRPTWRASLSTARHVTASVTPRDAEYDFLIDTNHGPVRMLAPTWEIMHDWVTTLRNKLHELKIVPLCENVYMSPPVAPPPRAAARDPTSPLPPTPLLPLDRVPGIDLTSVTRPPPIPESPAEPTPPDPPPEQPPEPEIDISNWDDLSLPSTSAAPTSVAKICGQNICLDDSLFKRGEDSEGGSEPECESETDYRQTVRVGRESETGDLQSDRPSNITVIQVSNKEPPHTAIPVIGPETNVFDFEFKNNTQNPDFINIVNTETEQNNYGTVFTETETNYGHLSLTTTVSLTGDVKNVEDKAEEDLYERLCLASTKPSPLPVRRLKSIDKVRKSSLPNLDTNNSTYEYLFLSQNNSSVNAENNSDLPTHNIQSTSNVTSISTEPSTNVTVNSTEVNSVSVSSVDTRGLRANIESERCQNATHSPRRERVNEVTTNGKIEKSEPQHKPIWKRGLTELSLLTRLRGIGQGKRPESPVRNDSNERNGVTSPAKIVHRSRPEARTDRSRRRSNSLSNGQSPPSTSNPTSLQPLRARQAAALIVAQRRGAAMVACISTADPPVFADYNKQVWIAWWGAGGARCAGRVGDRVCGLRATTPRDAAHAKQLMHSTHAYGVDILFHRVPLGKIYVVSKRDQETVGIKLDNECCITCVEMDSPAARAGISAAGKWAVTEVNNRPINLIKGGEDDMNRISLHGTETSILIQPVALVKKLRAALKGNKTLLGLK